MSSFLPVCEQQQKEIEAVRNQLSENEPMQWPFQMSIIYRILAQWHFQHNFLMGKVIPPTMDC
jgi:hypothetical protein